MVAKDLPDSSPAKIPAVALREAYEDKYGAGALSGLGANAYDAWLIVQNAAAVAEKSAKPGHLRIQESATRCDRKRQGRQGDWRPDQHDRRRSLRLQHGCAGRNHRRGRRLGSGKVVPPRLWPAALTKIWDAISFRDSVRQFFSHRCLFCFHEKSSKMTTEIFVLLGQDGITNGAIYALLALSLVLVYSVTRIVFVPEGEFVTYGAMTLASIQFGGVPGTLWILCGLSAVGRSP